MNIVDLAILKKMIGGGGGSGTDNYNDLSNLPQINGETLAGNKTAENLGLQEALTFDSTPTEDSTNPVESGGVYNALAGKQDNLTFDGVYDASTNKVATESTVTNAIAELDVSEISIGADETLSSISETDGKLSAEKQNIAIASNQISAMTGYTKPASQPATLAIQQSDTANAAIGKLEFKADKNTTNILYALNTGAKNLFRWNKWVNDCNVVGGTKTISDSGVMTLAASSSNCYTEYEGTTYPDVEIEVKENEEYVLTWEYGRQGGSGRGIVYVVFVNSTGAATASASAEYKKIEFTTPTGTTGLRIYINQTSSGLNEYYYNFMVCSKVVWDTLGHDYQPPSVTNFDLTRLQAEDRAGLIDVVDGGAKNLAEIPTTQTIGSVTFTKDSNEWITSNSATPDGRQWSDANKNVVYSVKAGRYIIYGETASTNTGAVDAYVIVNGSLNQPLIIIANSNRTVEVNLTSAGTIGLMYKPYSSNKVRYMICSKAEFGVSQKFVPWQTIPKVIYHNTTKFTSSTTMTYTGISYTIPAYTAIRITASALNLHGNPDEIAIASYSNQDIYLSHNKNFVQDKSIASIGTSWIYTTGASTYTIAILAKFVAATENSIELLVEKLN